MGLEVQILNPPPCKEKKTRFSPLAVISFSAAADLMEQVAIQILFFCRSDDQRNQARFG